MLLLLVPVCVVSEWTVEGLAETLRIFRGDDDFSLDLVVTDFVLVVVLVTGSVTGEVVPLLALVGRTTDLSGFTGGMGGVTVAVLLLTAAT